MRLSSLLDSTVAALLVPGKGLLAADESFPTIEKRFKAAGIPSSEENRRAYREMLFTAPGLSDFISGAILFDETIRQKARGGPMPEVLARQTIVPGIKVDRGAVPLAGFPGERVTQGLDGLRERLAEQGVGARGRQHETEQHPDRRRLARPVGAQETVDRAGWHGQVETVNRELAAPKPFRQADRADGWCDATCRCVGPRQRRRVERDLRHRPGLLRGGRGVQHIGVDRADEYAPVVDQ